MFKRLLMPCFFDDQLQKLKEFTVLLKNGFKSAVIASVDILEIIENLALILMPLFSYAFPIVS